jgi:hypothetical protein
VTHYSPSGNSSHRTMLATGRDAPAFRRSADQREETGRCRTPRSVRSMTASPSLDSPSPPSHQRPGRGLAAPTTHATANSFTRPRRSISVGTRTFEPGWIAPCFRAATNPALRLEATAAPIATPRASTDATFVMPESRNGSARAAVIRAKNPASASSPSTSAWPWIQRKRVRNSCLKPMIATTGSCTRCR